MEEEEAGSFLRSSSYEYEMQDFGSPPAELAGDSQPPPTARSFKPKAHRSRSFLRNWFFRKAKGVPRTIDLTGTTKPPQFPANVTRNQKYTLLTFIFVVLYEQFKFFFNLYFLIVALSQLIPALQVGMCYLITTHLYTSYFFLRIFCVGFLFTYIAPLVFVLSITILKEVSDDFKRWRRDREVNSEQFLQLTPNGLVRPFSFPLVAL